MLQTLLATAFLLAATTGWAYNPELAASYARLFEPVAGAKAGKALHLIKPEQFIEDLKRGRRFVTIDVRTLAEAEVFTMILPGSLVIPVNELFRPENLERLPRDRPIVVLCKSGTRATAAGTALRHIGFENAYILKGGFKALGLYLDAKTANLPPKPEKTGAQ
jgi:rhodanese-related sulfurtransferase